MKISIAVRVQQAQKLITSRVLFFEMEVQEAF